MLEDDEVPKAPNGGPALCHSCQRWTFFSGGFLIMVAEAVHRLAKRKFHEWQRQTPT